MSKMLVTSAVALLAATTLLASTADAAFNLPIGSVPSQVVQKADCDDLLAVRSANSTSKRSYEEDDEDHMADTAERLADDDEGENDEEDERVQPGSLAKKAVKGVREKTKAAASSKVAKTKPSPTSSKQNAAAVKPVEPEKTEQAENVEKAQNNAKIERTAVVESKVECKRFFPSVGMTLSVHCE